MESDSKFKQSFECDELNYNFISGYKIEVEHMTINEQQDTLPRKPDPFVLKYARINRLLLRQMFKTINKSKKPII